MSIDFPLDCIEDESQEYQGKPEVGGVITPKNVTNIYLTVTTSYDPMLVDNNDDEYVLTISPIENP